MDYAEEIHGDKGRTRHGSKRFYDLLEEMAVTHDKKSHDYATNTNPFGNYYFAGEMALLFKHSSKDAGFVGRLAEKIYRLSVLESSGLIPKNESVEDTERDIAVIATLWMAARRTERGKQPVEALPGQSCDIPEKPQQVDAKLRSYVVELLSCISTATDRELYAIKDEITKYLKSRD